MGMQMHFSPLYCTYLHCSRIQPNRQHICLFFNVINDLERILQRLQKEKVVMN